MGRNIVKGTAQITSKGIVLSVDSFTDISEAGGSSDLAIIVGKACRGFVVVSDTKRWILQSGGYKSKFRETISRKLFASRLFERAGDFIFERFFEFYRQCDHTNDCRTFLVS